jgi:hypothetical protein
VVVRDARVQKKRERNLIVGNIGVPTLTFLCRLYAAAVKRLESEGRTILGSAANVKHCTTYTCNSITPRPIILGTRSKALEKLLGYMVTSECVAAFELAECYPSLRKKSASSQQPGA